MASPFALERLTEQSNISTDRARDNYFKSQSQKATRYLADEADRLSKQKKVKGMNPWLKTALTIGANVAMPGLGGILVSGALSAGDSLVKDKKYKDQIKALGGARAIPAQFKGTFMEDYITGGISSAKAQKKSQLEGARKLLDFGLSVIPGLGEMAKGAKTVGKEAAKGTAKEVSKTAAKESAKEGISAEGSKTLLDVLTNPENFSYLKDEASDTPLNQLFSNIDKSIAGEATQELTKEATSAAGKEQLEKEILEKTLAQKLAGKAGTQIKDLIPFADALTGSLYQGAGAGRVGMLSQEALLQELLRPSSYRGLGLDEYQNFLLGGSQEPTINRLDARYRRRR